MTPLVIIIQIFALLAETAQPRLFQPDQEIDFLTLRDQFEQAANNSNTRIYFSNFQNVTSSDHLLVSPVQSMNSTLNSSITSLGEQLNCEKNRLTAYDSCRQAFSLLPRDTADVSFGRFARRHRVTHVLPYALTSCQ